MAKIFETFEQAHGRALKAAHDELVSALSREGLDALGRDLIYRAIETYENAMGYSQPRGEDADLRAIDKAWDRAVREGGDRLVLGDLIDRCIRASVLAVGERWSAEPDLDKRTVLRRAA